MTLKRFAAAFAVALSSLALVPAAAHAGGGGGGGTVAGPCGRLSGVTASPSVTISKGVATPLALKGSIVNCSIYQQRYWINIDEPAPANPNCAANALYFPNSIWSSGSSQSFSVSTSIVPAGATDFSGCAGTHTVRLTLKDRSFGYVQQVVSLTYTVVVK
jgi:hypothetical protein